MGRRETDFEQADRIDPELGGAQSQCAFEIYVSEGFCDLEFAAICQTLRVANDLLAQPVFSWQAVSASPGYVTSRGGMLAEAKPVLDGVLPPHTMMVVGGTRAENEGWMRRLRAMKRRVLPVVLLSDAATAYIRSVGATGAVTTHWRDVHMLSETGFHPNLSTRFSEKSDGVITAAGGGATHELMIGLIAPLLSAPQVAELGNRLLLHTIRKSDSEQPKNISANAGLFDCQITRAIQTMEDNIADPISMTELSADIGVSTRHLERAFRTALQDTPARFYKRLRTRRARAMIEETVLPLIEVAIATGFSSNHMLSKAIKEEYGQRPSEMRARKQVKLLNFEQHATGGQSAR